MMQENKPRVVLIKRQCNVLWLNIKHFKIYFYQNNSLFQHALHYPPYSNVPCCILAILNLFKEISQKQMSQAKYHYNSMLNILNKKTKKKKKSRNMAQKALTKESYDQEVCTLPLQGREPERSPTKKGWGQCKWRGRSSKSSTDKPASLSSHL